MISLRGKAGMLTPGLLKLALPLALVLGAAAGVLSQNVAVAQEMEGATYTVHAGASGPSNQDLLIFAPQDVQVHRGDTIIWLYTGIHNIHFEPEPAPLVLEQEIDGQVMPVLNPAISTPNIADGATFTGGDVNSGIGLLLGQPAFSLVIDAEPGTYTYFCDIHPGMAGTVTVVDDATPVPSPAEVSIQAAAEIGATVDRGIELWSAAFEAGSEQMMSEGGGARVQAGAGVETSVQQFFPFTVVINAGESVTWFIEEDSREPHTVTWPPLFGQEFTPIEQEDGPPILALGPGLAPLTPDGTEIGAGDAIQNVIFPGQEFTLVFTEPGVYPYVCNLHLGMQGTVVVMPAA